MREAVLSIYYVDKNKRLHHEPQGKIFYLHGKVVYLADMTQAKWWRVYGGYSIAKQILDAFLKVRIKPQIIYRRRDLGMVYLATATLFMKKGILTSFGGHKQFVLPIKNYKAILSRTMSLNEPKNLPIMTAVDWSKTALPAQKPLTEKERFIQTWALL